MPSNADTCFVAAEYMEAKGWCRGVSHTGEVCMLSAIMNTTVAARERVKCIFKLYEMTPGGVNIVLYNDNFVKDKEEAVNFLFNCANRLYIEEVIESLYTS